MLSELLFKQINHHVLKNVSASCVCRNVLGCMCSNVSYDFIKKVYVRTMNILNILSFFRVIVQASFSLFNLPLADIVDADLIKHKRRYVSLECFSLNTRYICHATLS